MSIIFYGRFDFFKIINLMNYEKHLLALVAPQEVGNFIVVVNQTKKEMECVKLHLSGNNNISISNKNFKTAIHDKTLEVIEKLPNDVFSAIKNTWHTNSALH